MSKTNHPCSKLHYANTGWGQTSLNVLIQKLDIKAAEKVDLNEHDVETGQKSLCWGWSSGGCELSSRGGTRNRSHCEFHLVLPVCFCPKRTHLFWVLLNAWGDNRDPRLAWYTSPSAHPCIRTARRAAPLRASHAGWESKARKTDLWVGATGVIWTQYLLWVCIAWWPSSGSWNIFVSLPHPAPRGKGASLVCLQLGQDSLKGEAEASTCVFRNPGDTLPWGLPQRGDVLNYWVPRTKNCYQNSILTYGE